MTWLSLHAWNRRIHDVVPTWISGGAYDDTVDLSSTPHRRLKIRGKHEPYLKKAITRLPDNAKFQEREVDITRSQKCALWGQVIKTCQITSKCRFFAWLLGCVSKIWSPHLCWKLCFSTNVSFGFCMCPFRPQKKVVWPHIFVSEQGEALGCARKTLKQWCFSSYTGQSCSNWFNWLLRHSWRRYYCKIYFSSIWNVLWAQFHFCVPFRGEIA